MIKGIKPGWIKKRKEDIRKGRPIHLITSFDKATQTLITLLAKTNIPFKLYNLGVGVKELTTDTDTCPCCKRKLKEKTEEKLEDNPLEYQVGGDHYKCFKIQPIEFITANKLSFLQGCIIKRVCRCKTDDLNKIRHELKLMEKLGE